MKEPGRKYQTHIPRASDYIRAKVPIVVQMESVECGAAALCSILAYYGKIVPLEQLRVDCGVSRDGVSAFGIIQAAQKYGLLAEAHQVDLKELYEMPVPLIAFWNFEHFVVIEGFSREAVYLMDPGVGRTTITYNDLNAAFTGIVILFDPSLEFEKSGQPFRITEALLQIFQRERRSFTFAFLAGLLLVLPQLALPAFAQIFIDNILAEHSYNWREWFLFSVSVVIVFTLGLKFLELNSLSRLYIKLTTAFSGEFLWHILRLPYIFYIQRNSGEIANRMPLNENVYKTVSTQLSSLVIDASVSIAFAAALFYYDVWVAFLGLFMVFVSLYFMYSIFQSRLDAYAYYQQTSSKSKGYSISALRSIESVKANSLEYRLFSRWAGYYTKALNALQEIGKKDVLAGTVPSFLMLLTEILVLCLGGWRVIHGSMTVGMLFAMLLLINLLMMPITRLVSFIQLAQFLKIDVSRLNDVLKNPVDRSLIESEKSDKTLMKEFSYSKLKGSLEISHLTFGYDRAGDPVLEDINLKMTPGTMIAIVGATGSGKSTLAKLLGGLFYPWQGTILFDQTPREELPRTLLTNSIGIVEQEACLFFGTVKENIAFFNPLIEESEIIKAAKDAHIHEEILLRKGGYDLLLRNNGKNLSGGQRQRLEIARVLAMQPTLLILDEATSALDSDTEMRVMENIRRRGCTCVVIAHRISSTRFCDEIIVLDKGHIVQRGFHEDLMAEEGLYRNLYELEKSKDEA